LENPQFEISYFMVAPSGGAEKNLNMSARLHTIAYIKPQDLKMQGSIAFRLSQNGETDMLFWALPVRTL